MTTAAHTVTAVESISLSLLHGFELSKDGDPLYVPLSAQRVVAFLALHDRPLLRSYVAGTLWTETSEERANARLRTALWRVRRPDCRVVRSSSAGLSLDPDVAVDLRLAEAVAQRVIEHQGGVADLATLCRARDLLPDWYDEWLLMERERFRQLRLHALEALCEDLRDAGNYAAAIESGLAAIAGEPLRESAHRVLISTYLAEGNVAEAIRQYDVYRTLLADNIGLEPSTRIQELVRNLLPVRARARLPKDEAARDLSRPRGRN